MNRLMCTRLLPTLLVLAAAAITQPTGQSQQIAIPRIEQMPNMPAPYLMRDWKQTALGYDSLVYDLARTGQYLPLIYLNTSTVNYPGQTSFGLDSYVGTKWSESGETINVLPSVVGATLCGVDKSTQNGYNWALMCQEYFNKRPAENVYLNAPVASSGSDWWYDVMPNVFFYQLYSLYSHTGDFDNQFKTVADRWLEAIYAMGGSNAPWSHPSLEHRGWYLATMTPNNELPHEPEAGGSMSWILYNAYVHLKDRRYLAGAELSMEELNAYTRNPAYELQLSYGTYLAARMNGELGTAFDVAKMVNWCFDVSSIRPWGATVGNWGGYDCSGLIGELNYGDDYAFAMNTFEQIGALVPLVRYDSRFARAIGKWVLNAANASRLFYSDYLPDANQDSRAWSSQYDPGSYIAHEALRQQGPGNVRPYATGDAIDGGWAATNLSLYSSSHVGILGGIIDTTNVRGILSLDLLRTDYFRDTAYTSFLFFNPDSVQHDVQLDVGPGSHDVYDAATHAFVLNGVSGVVALPVPANAAVAAVITPAGGTVTYNEERMLVNGVIVDYHSGTIPPNYRPRIKGLGALPDSVFLGGVTQLYCTATDRDGVLDTLGFIWKSTAGSFTGSGPHVAWNAPLVKGDYTVSCKVLDEGGAFDSLAIVISVVDSALSVPMITDLFARPGKVDLNASTEVTCLATDPKGYPLQYTWSSLYGTISGTDSVAQWTAPSTVGNYWVVCIVSNGQGGEAMDSVLIPVRDYSQGGTGDLILLLPFNGNANDQSGFNNNGTVNGAILVADRFGVSSRAYGFNGSTANIRVPNSSSLNCSNAITVSFWMKASNMLNREMFPLSHGSWQNRWKVSIIPERKIRWTIKTTGGVIDLDSRTTVAAGTYYFVTGVYNGADCELYVNGELERFASWSGTILTPSIDLMVGQMLPTDADYNFQGVVDDIRIHNYALNYPDVQSLYQLTSAIHQEGDGGLPRETALFQNYPNPFNPTTTIRYAIPVGTYNYTSLQIYDILGREVATLVHERKEPGMYTVQFDGGGLASGVYLYRLTAGSFVQTHTMILMR
jgi:hypothetical protein